MRVVHVFHAFVLMGSLSTSPLGDYPEGPRSTRMTIVEYLARKPYLNLSFYRQYRDTA